MMILRRSGPPDPAAVALADSRPVLVGWMAGEPARVEILTMPSPFPGMDPYLEAPDIWPDFHNRLATRISDELNESLPRPYYARLEMRPEIGIVEEGRSRKRIVPDVVVVRHPHPTLGAGGVAVL